MSNKWVTENGDLVMKYFVLSPWKDSPHGVASRAAMRTYADTVAKVDPAGGRFARSIMEWVDHIELEMERGNPHERGR